MKNEINNQIIMMKKNITPHIHEIRGSYSSPRIDVRIIKPEVNFCDSFTRAQTESLDEEVEFEW